MLVELDGLITANAFGGRKTRFDWEKGVVVTDTSEVRHPLMIGSPVIIKNGRPESPYMVSYISGVIEKDGRNFYVVPRILKEGNRKISEEVNIPTERKGLGRYQTDDGRYTVFNSTALGCEGIRRYLMTVDKSEKGGNEHGN